MQNQHQLEDIYVTFQKTNNQNQNQDYEDKKKNGISTVRKITEQIKAIDLKMQIHQNEIDKDFDGDAVFPRINEEIWREISRDEGLKDEDNNVTYDFITYVRK